MARIMKPITEYRHASAEESAARLAAHVAAILEDAIARRGAAFIAVSGGSTPALLFDRLSEIPLDWARVTVAQVDERWVDPASPDSNQHLIRHHLLQNAASAANFVPMHQGASDARQGQAAYERILCAMPGPFDVILLGMGNDGHTASLFPAAPELDAGLAGAALCLALTPPAASHQRLTLSLAGLLRSRLLVLQLQGAAKEAVYRAAIGEGAVADMPVRAVLRQEHVPVEVWFSA